MQNESSLAVSTRLIGMLTPSSNTVLEPYTSLLLQPLFPDVTAHFGRFRVTRIALDEDANEQFKQEPILSAADLLADARPDVLAWNGTSASWLGFDTDQRLCDAIESRTGVPATSAILSLNRLLAERGVERIALVTPYTADVEEKIAGNYARIGISTVARRHSGLSDNFSFAEVSEQTIEAMCEDVATAKPDAIAIVCTNMRGAIVGAEVERRTGVPVFDSVSFTLWGCLRALGVSMAPLARFGTMFADDGRISARSPAEA
ncbi:aspartate/glutamate racemase family protein [Flaviflagellibacter deserti]|uniref:Aspartate/glutamate racemase family protein n=1 Tax=Flaviflagellibacter deserti TaxID=2267266 RepID=A0ABV9Z4N7_9HYPH